jgi:hypothetical protein
MPSTKIALLSEVPEIDAAALARTAAAIQRQLSDEFAPAWDIEATIHHFLDTKDVPDDYWRLTVTWDVPEGEGVHKDDQG